MNYAKIGPLCNAVVKAATKEGYGLPKLIVSDWGETKIKLKLLCLNEEVPLIEHRLSNEDVVYDRINSIPDDFIYDIRVDITYDRINNVYKEKYDNIADEVYAFVHTGDPLYEELDKLFIKHQARKLLLTKEDIQRNINIGMNDISRINHILNNKDDAEESTRDIAEYTEEDSIPKDNMPSESSMNKQKKNSDSKKRYIKVWDSREGNRMNNMYRDMMQFIEFCNSEDICGGKCECSSDKHLPKKKQ